MVVWHFVVSLIDMFIILSLRDTPSIRLRQDILNVRRLPFLVSRLQIRMLLFAKRTFYNCILVSQLISLDFQIVVSFCMLPMANPILLLMSSQLVALSLITLPRYVKDVTCFNLYSSINMDIGLISFVVIYISVFHG